MPTNNSTLTAHDSPLKRLAVDHGLVIDPEFRALCPTPSADESAQLERSLLAEGCRDNLVAWKSTSEILDGYNRHPLCERHGVPYGVVFLELPDREACKRWILTNQLSRRNISSQAASYLRGTRYLMEKQPHGGDHVNSAEATYHGDRLETAKRLAGEFHVGIATIYRDGSFAAAVDAIVATCGQQAKEVILARESVVTRRAVLLMAKMTADLRQQAIEVLIETGKLPRRTREGKRATITLPAEPKALAETLIGRLGAEACSRIVGEIKKLLPRQPAAQARNNSTARETTAAERDTEEGKGEAGKRGDAVTR